MEVDHSTDATAATQPRTDAALSTLQPAAHRERFLHLQTSARYAGSSDPTTQMGHILALLETYRNAAQRSTLLPHDWDVFLALEARLASATGPLTPDSLQALFQLHNDATAHAQSIDLIKRYIGLMLAYFTQLSGVSVALSSTQSTESTSTSTSYDPASRWTRLESCPTIDAHSSTYIAASLPPLSQDATDPAAWDPVCGIEAIRWRIREAYTRCAYQLSESQDIWKLYLAFEEALLSSSLVPQDQQLETVRHAYLARLKVPHTAIDETFQAFSGFVTQHLPPQQYENEMSAANVLVAESRAILRQREQHEDALTPLFRAGTIHTAGSRQDLDNFAAYCKPYLRWQSNRAIRAMRSKDKAAAQTELDLACSLFERLIPHFGLHPPSTHKHELVYYSDDVKASEHYAREFKRLSHEEREARTQQEQQLFSERLSLATDLWLDYISVLTSSHRPDASLIMDVCTRAVHCLPTAVGLHCVLMRNSARFRRSCPQVEQLFENVGTPGAVELRASELTDLCLARIDAERELASFDLVVKAGADLHIDPAQDMDKFTEIYALLSYSLGKLAELGDDRDASLRLEKATVNWVERAVFAMGGPASEGGAGLNELAESVWQTAVAQQPDNALVYREAAGYWARRLDAGKARGWFKAGVSKLERRQSQESSAEFQTLLQEWVQFEHQYGSIEEVEYADGEARAERQRVLEAWYASYAQYGYQAESQAPTQAANGHDGSAMQVEATTNHAPSSVGKRKADDEDADTSIADAPMATRTEEPSNPADPSLEQPKKTRTTDTDTQPSRDREHCSVLVSNLDPSTDAASIRTFLRGCGRIVELTGPTILGSTAAALVEFADPLGASSALTRHNKPLSSTTVSVYIGWKCTLFVTNFPEEWDDAAVRDTFSAHGLVFTVRWPSRRFVASRRFCYVQYTTPASAAAAVGALDGREVVPGRRLGVALSDPAREAGDEQLPRNITDADLRGFFEEFGAVTGVRLLRNAEGALRGIGFVDFESALDATRAMREINSTKWRGKTISVTIAENRGHATRADGKGRKARSVRVDGLPVDAQEALIQQAMERATGLGSVKQVLWRPDGVARRATVEFRDVSDAGKAVLVGGAGGVKYVGETETVLSVTALEDDAASQVGSPPPMDQSAAGAPSLAFVPRASRGGRGRGRGRAFAMASVHQPSSDKPAADDMEVEPHTDTNSSSNSTGQDRFRAMLQRPQ